MCPINVLEGEDILEMISNKFEELEIDEVDDLFESELQEFHSNLTMEEVDQHYNVLLVPCKLIKQLVSSSV